MNEDAGLIFFSVVAACIVVAGITCIVFAVQHRSLTRDYDALIVTSGDLDGPSRAPNKHVDLEEYADRHDDSIELEREKSDSSSSGAVLSD